MKVAPRSLLSSDPLHTKTIQSQLTGLYDTPKHRDKVFHNKKKKTQ